MLYNIYLLLIDYLEKGRTMHKRSCASKNMEAKTLPADVCIFGRFGQLSPAAVHSADSWFDSRVRCCIHVLSNVTYLSKNSFLLRWNSCKQCSESSTHCCSWSTVSKLSIYFEQSFLIDKCSSKMVNTLHSDIFNSSAISRNFNLRLAKTNLWSFWCFMGQLPNLGDLNVWHHLCLYDHI